MEGTRMKTETFISVWDALADTEQEAANLKARSALLHAITRQVDAWADTQDKAAKRLGLTRPRLNDLLNGKLNKLSLYALVNIAASARLTVEIGVSHQAKRAA